MRRILVLLASFLLFSIVAAGQAPTLIAIRAAKLIDGKSEKPHDPAAYALELMAADVNRLLVHLKIHIAHYVGYSMGGRIGIQALLDFSPKLNRVVLGGVGWGGSHGEAQEIARAMRGEPTTSEVARSFYDFARARPSNGNASSGAARCNLR